ncbi:MAG: hypothetical protein ABWY18_00395 [Tardiphaga sp.]
MAIVSSAPSSASNPAQSGFFHEMREFWQTFFVAAFDPYRPEQHYMRGPGPACQAKSTADTPSGTAASH